jgi:hypothetical protein
VPPQVLLLAAGKRRLVDGSAGVGIGHVELPSFNMLGANAAALGAIPRGEMAAHAAETKMGAGVSTSPHWPGP